jgi:hypothetical protein
MGSIPFSAGGPSVIQNTHNESSAAKVLQRATDVKRK